jgi:hypothetical protein
MTDARSLDETLRLIQRTTLGDADHTTLHTSLATVLNDLQTMLDSGQVGGPMDLAELEARIQAVQEAITVLESSPGPPGVAGPPGPQGSTGTDGVVGAVGPQGPQGPAGGVGQKGPVGDVGPMGPQGVPGANGGFTSGSGVSGISRIACGIAAVSLVSTASRAVTNIPFTGYGFQRPPAVIVTPYFTNNYIAFLNNAPSTSGVVAGLQHKTGQVTTATHRMHWIAYEPAVIAGGA